MSNYAMNGNGGFGGSNNFLALMGGVGNDWLYGMNQGMGFGKALTDYQNQLYTAPSATRAAIAKNTEAQGTSEGNHYRNYMDNQILSYLAGGGNPSDPSSPFNPYWGQSRMPMLTGSQTIPGTPVSTQTNSSPTTATVTTKQVNSAGSPVNVGSSPGFSIQINPTGQQKER